MDQDKIGQFIKHLRTEKELSQYQLADLVPISRQAVSKWERGESIPDSSTLIRLSDIFDVTINELLAGKRLKDNSIKQLENTTLSILDDSNRKSKRIKRNFIVSTTIITILLLLFLSYYFINSYNSTKVYTITCNGENFKIRDGLFITTKGKKYIRLGNIKYNEDLNITNIKLYYKSKNKENIILDDNDIEEFVLVDNDGYSEKVPININHIINNLYIKISYDDKEENIKLKLKRDYSNSSLMFKNRKKYNAKLKSMNKYEGIKIGTTIGVLFKKEEPKKGTIPPPSNEMKEDENVSAIVQHDKTLEIKKDNEVEEKNTPFVEEKLDIDKVLSNLKSNSFEFDGTYIYEDTEEPIMILYYESINQLTLYKNDEFMWDYYINEDRYNCSPTYGKDCKNEVMELLKNYSN